MNITEQLIERFFQDQCSADEANAVIAYLNEHQDILEKYIGEQDWTAYQRTERLHPVVSEKMLSTIRKSFYGEVRSIGWLRYVSAAAVLTAVAFGVLYFINANREQVGKPIAKVKQENVSPVLKLIKNRTKDVQEITLVDGSLVKLEANSELRYYDPYESDKRSFYLSGEAYFKVAKDSIKPFTVYSNEISTTALGTAFRVIAFEKKNLITVKLYEGKIIVKGVATIKKLEKDYFLTPGDEFTYNRMSNTAKVVRYVKPVSGLESKVERADDDSNETNWFMFNNQKLSQVLDQLSAIYNVKIEYSEAELNKMSFIGKIEKSDSIEQILNDIALLNNLTVKKTGNGYSIRRK